MVYDVSAIRTQFPALNEGMAHFDGPGGSQTPQAVADAISRTLTSAIANRGTINAAERRAEETVVAARVAMADLLGAEPRGIVFGRSMTANTFDLARTLAHDWGPGDEVVVTTLDHDGNIRPWVRAAERAGATVRWAQFDPATGELDPGQVAAVLSERTRLVAVTGASNLIGTRPDIPAISRIAHDAGALVHLDVVHLAAHAVVDLATLGVDFVACSPYKFCGPHIGVLAADPALLERLHPDKLLPSPEQVPERFELGTLPYELLAGVTATVDFLAGLAEPHPSTTSSTGSRRDRLVASFSEMEQHEEALIGRLRGGLELIDGIQLYSRAAHRTPTVLFGLDGIPSATLSRDLAAAGVNAPAGHFYAIEASRQLDLGDTGAVRAGLAPYTNADDVDRLVAGVRQAATQR